MANPNDLNIIKLGERKADIFLDVVNSDLIKILKTIEKKKKRDGYEYDSVTPKANLGKIRPK